MQKIVEKSLWLGFAPVHQINYLDFGFVVFTLSIVVTICHLLLWGSLVMQLADRNCWCYGVETVGYCEVGL